MFRQVLVNREKSAIVIDNSTENYSVFNAKYINSRTEVTNHFNFIQMYNFRVNLEKFLLKWNTENYLKTIVKSIYDSMQEVFYTITPIPIFLVLHWTDQQIIFLIIIIKEDPKAGFFSQQFILAEGGFKSKLDTPYANQWITTLNGSFTIWNWIEVYGDVGFIKNKNQKEQFVMIVEFD